jgi:hypothetical protein
MATQSKIGWRAYVNPSTLWASVFSVWNGEGTNNLTVKNAWNANGDAVDSKSGANGTIAAPSGTTFVTGTMSFGTGKLGSGAFTFNGSNFVSLPTNTLKFTGDFSASYWIYVPTSFGTNGSRVLVAFDNSAGYTTYKGWDTTYSNGKVSFYMYPGVGTDYYGISVPMTLKDQWVHVTVTKVLKQQGNIYINGIAGTKTVDQRGSGASTQEISYNVSHLAYMGSSYNAFQPPFYVPTVAGGFKQDAIQTWDGVALDQTAVTELYNSGNGQQYPFTLSNALITTYKDVVGTNHGTTPASTLTNGVPGPSFTTGKIGKAFSFDGINDFIQLPNNSMNFTGDFSISAWLYYPPETQLVGNIYAFILSNWTAISWDTNLAGWRFITYGNTIYFSTFNGTSTTVLLGAPGMGLDRSGWRHVAFTRTGTTYKLWLDGGQYTSTSTTMLAPKYQGTIIPKIGRLGDSTMGGWDSYSSPIIKIDAVSVWNKALTASEITELYNSGNGKQYPN